MILPSDIFNEVCSLSEPNPEFRGFMILRTWTNLMAGILNTSLNNGLNDLSSVVREAEEVVPLLVNFDYELGSDI